MHVSFVELFLHCKKVFRAHGISYGCADDGAEVVAWSEFAGLHGLQVLKKEISDMPDSGMRSIMLVSKEEGLYRFNGNGQSAIILGKLMADYALGLSETQNTVRVHMSNTTRSRLLAYAGHYIASRDKGCVINYRMQDGTPMWILSTPEVSFPIFAEGEIAESIMQKNLTEELGRHETNDLSTDEFWMVCTDETELITGCVRKLRWASKNGDVKLMESAQLKAIYEQAYFNGAEVDSATWDILDEVGRKTLVEATDESRVRGAGEKAE
ncbi:DUF3726 domain-containing protein [Salinicoccus carnicancri]|uniref:DUF3726 domain-containing protein n=1 Tax=Salinicoccus carnicancri TaxID=558170 RepID=UPI0002D708CA|nr:DUF3726 domain-containing protein [Salinicoccus carnicancri]